MSIAGKTSSQGDEFELQVALHWLISLYRDEEINFVQVDSTGIPDLEQEIPIDDIIVAYKDGRKKFIQAKKNQPKYQVWRFSDKVLKEELVKALEQHELTSNAEIWFYSRSPFGNLQKLAEGARKFRSYNSFKKSAPKTLLDPLKSLARIISPKVTDLSLKKSYALAKVLFFDSSQDWASRNLLDLKPHFPQANTVKSVLERLVAEHAASLPGTPYELNRLDFLEILKEHSLESAPIYSEADVLKNFQSASRIGRTWGRTIDGVKVDQPELIDVLDYIKVGNKNILVTSLPGCGKTCLLLDLVDQFETDPSVGVLFIKGDQYSDANSEADLTRMGLPEGIVGQCARLAEFRRVVVVVDSLDVLSLSRSHGAFKIILSVIDRLSLVDNTIVVAACREFDRQYDPQLRDRDWQKIIKIAPFDYGTVVRPLLDKWAVDDSDISESLQSLICVPQNLNLFKRLVESKSYLELNNAWDLFDRYLVEYVEKDSLLGNRAIDLLYRMAQEMMKNRCYTLPKVRISSETRLSQRLISQGVLVEQQPGVIAFSHQTLADNLLVRGSITNGEGLVDFIHKHLPLPFIRPVVKSFFGYLRVLDRVRFSREFRKALSDDKIAYHLKRLLVESFAEMSVDDKDWSLVRYLLNDHSALFRRCLYTMADVKWLDMIEQKLLTAFVGKEDRSALEQIVIQRLTVWIEKYPERVIALWTALYDNSPEKAKQAYNISIYLGDLKEWTTVGVGALLERLLSVEGYERDFIGRPLSLWVDATNSGDKLLWDYIINKVPDAGPSKHGKKELRCDGYDFHDDKFLEKRFQKSELLLGFAIDSLIEWSQKEVWQSDLHSFSNYFLMDSSWRYTHNKHETYSADGINTLLSCVESALNWHAHQDTIWWKDNELKIRDSREFGFMYFLALCYKNNPEKNIIGISSLLTDKELLRFGRIEFELGQLANSAYHLLTEEVAAKNQDLVMSLYSEEKYEDGEYEWIKRKRYDYLVWIPNIYRIKAAQDFVDEHRRTFGYELPTPQIWSSGGTVRQPFDHKILCQLSHPWAMKLVWNYNEDAGFVAMDDRLLGGKRQALWGFREASALCPKYMLGLLPLIRQEKLDVQFICDIFAGLAQHVRYLYGNLSSAQKDWEPFEKSISKEELRDLVQTGLELTGEVWSDLGCVSSLLMAGVHVAANPSDIAHLVRMHEKFYSQIKTVSSEENYVIEPGAEALICLAENCIKNDWAIGEEVDKLLVAYAQMGDESVLITFLRYLAYLIHYNPESSWVFFLTVMGRLNIEKWWAAERCFYYNYHKRTDEILPYIEKLLVSGSEEGLEVAGRIYTLMYLSDVVDEEEYFSRIARSPEKAIQGAVQNLAHNLYVKDVSDKCRKILPRLFAECSLTNTVMESFASVFHKDSSKVGMVGNELVFSYLKALPKVPGSPGINSFYRWLSAQAKNDPLQNLEYLEVLADACESCVGDVRQYGSRNHIPIVLREILIEADEVDDPELINRVINVQDRLMQNGFDGISKLYDDY
ncbi:AAA family ATPase [Maridesulfovibrio sp.]|uniref:AAA family ATPase n=1 Tax=unclassified Maridesulfovibrio TaxID=2794999 RepID=UPI003AFFB6FA